MSDGDPTDFKKVKEIFDRYLIVVFLLLHKHVMVSSKGTEEKEGLFLVTNCYFIISLEVFIKFCEVSKQPWKSLGSLYPAFWGLFADMFERHHQLQQLARKYLIFIYDGPDNNILLLAFVWCTCFLPILAEERACLKDKMFEQTSLLLSKHMSWVCWWKQLGMLTPSNPSHVFI